jgi:hypothetical protein
MQTVLDATVKTFVLRSAFHTIMFEAIDVPGLILVTPWKADTPRLGAVEMEYRCPKSVPDHIGQMNDSGNMKHVDFCV